MTRKLIMVAILGIVSASALLAAGCSATNANPPYSLTGQPQVQADRKHQEWLLRQRFTDEKGHYHPELAAAHQPIR